MPTTIISRGRFHQFREKFYQTNRASPVFADFTLTSKVPNTPEDDPLLAFVGSSQRDSTTVKIPIMYNRNYDPVFREKFGLEQPKQGSIFVSPKLLLQYLGTWKLREETTLVYFFNKEYLVEKVFYLGDIPQYGDCIAVELQLKSATKGI